MIEISEVNDFDQKIIRRNDKIKSDKKREMHKYILHLQEKYSIILMLTIYHTKERN